MKVILFLFRMFQDLFDKKLKIIVHTQLVRHVETAKANTLNVYEYMKNLLTVIPSHTEDTDINFCEQLLPSSEDLPECCHRKK